jgi:myo-inositol-1(or 4)-monophosphatase
MIFGSFVNCFSKFHSIRGGGEIVSEGAAFGDLKKDTEIRADKESGNAFLEYFQKVNYPIGHLTVEGMQTLETGSGFLWVTVDPLDGSLNYKAGSGELLPYSACVTILRKRQDATFSDVLAGGVIDLRTGSTWISARSAHGSFQTRFGSILEGGFKSVTTDSAVQLKLGEQVLLGEMYYPDNRVALAIALDEHKGSLRSLGSAAYEMALVASGQCVAFVSSRQKQHELGAAYALVKGAGGVVVDWDGKDIESRSYDFETQVPVVLACTEGMANDLVSRLQKARSM